MKNKANLYNATKTESTKGLTRPCARVCRICGVTDKVDNELLELRFDIVEGEDRGLFTVINNEKKDGRFFYQGTYGLFYKDDSMKSFKAAITSIEESNPNYHWDWNENGLVGKFVVVVYGEVETEVVRDGKREVITLIKPRWFRSLKAYREAQKEGKELPLPDKKPLPNRGGYNDYAQPQQPTYTQPQAPQSFGVDVSDDDLPF